MPLTASPSVPIPKFLLDENVRRELQQFLRERNADVRVIASGSLDMAVAMASVSENRILVTNDADFFSYPATKLFGVVWLRVPQHDGAILCRRFEMLMETDIAWKGARIILSIETWKISQLK